MASYARCSFFFLLIILSIFLQIHAREIKHFSKVTKPTKENHESISVSLVPSPSPAPALSPAESEAVVEHGYGLYGRDPYENIPENTVKGNEKPVFEEEKYVPVAELSQENNGERFENGFPKDNFVGDEYQYTPTVENPTKTNVVGEEKYVHTNEFNNNNNNNNEYVSEKQGMSDTRFLENGKYYYDVNQEGNKDMNNYVRNEGNNEGYVPQKQGMSDTKFLENGKYFYDIQNEEGVNKGDNDVSFDANNNNENNEQFQEERHGMSDTHYLNNGKYFYDVNNENEKNNNLYNNNMNNNNNNNNNNLYNNNNNNNNNNNLYNNNNNNNGYVNENEGYYNFEGNTKKHSNEYVTQGQKGNFGSPKKFPNEYDTMEEYDREQGYVDPQAVYVP